MDNKHKEEINSLFYNSKNQNINNNYNNNNNNIVYEKFDYYLEENREFANNLIQKSLRAFRAREAARKARDDVRLDKKKKENKLLNNGKLTPAQGKDKNLSHCLSVSVLEKVFTDLKETSIFICI